MPNGLRQNIPNPNKKGSHLPKCSFKKFMGNNIIKPEVECFRFFFIFETKSNKMSQHYELIK